jgi:hypothetical protein
MIAAPAFDPFDPRWIAHRYERVRDEVHYRYVPRSEHGDFPFLTDEYVGSRPEAWLGRREAVLAVGDGGGAPLRLIFHSAFCASTLLCRAFDRSGLSMGLSEPAILNDIVGMRRRKEAEPKHIARLLDEAMRLLARPWGAGEAVVIKPSNILNPLAAAMLALRPEAKAVLLHAPLPVFLGSVARKGMWCRLWARELLEGLLADGAVDLGFAPTDYFRLTDLQVAAVGWLAQHSLFGDLEARFGSRAMRVESEAMLAGPADHIGRIGRHFGLAVDAALAAEIAAGPAFTRHSKFGQAFDAGARAAEKAAAEATHGDEIAKVEEWTRAVAESAGVALN